jgi:hypothetical protein
MPRSFLLNVTAVVGLAALTTIAQPLWAQSNTPPFITRQPTNQTVMEGQTATFTVQAIGEFPLTYQWYHNGLPLTDLVTNGVAINGAKTSTLSVTARPSSAGTNWVTLNIHQAQ